MTNTITPVYPSTLQADELSRRQVAEMLQTTARSVEKLTASGYLPDLRAGRVLSLARRPFLYTDGVQPVLRQAVAQIDPDGERDYIGEGAMLTDAQQLDADRRWWRCDAEQVVAAGLLPVTLAGFVVTVLKIIDTETQVRRVIPGRGAQTTTVEVRYAFSASIAGRSRALGEPERDYLAPDLSDQERDTVQVMLGGRSSARSGGPFAYLPQIGA
ncbi:hypothetical protein [Cellulomonas sp. HD19AZ1]|uniref:hypothetical protein n=1 Tax=Cellulomonas sp. HD19AZ1 TaxID=2559593 RepID=UPI001070997D|nr:hypothetical protein [Cellulomonas sp. HD19AZ1]TFH68152.1 hypothetical protein E4A51_18075 [Cellulomonas sp. HD19AZ1]